MSADTLRFWHLTFQEYLAALGAQPTRAAQARAAGLLGALVRDLAPFDYRPADPRYTGILAAALAVFDPQQAPAILLPADRVVRLPTEAEWEYAARGEGGRCDPWGDAAPDVQRANFDEAKVGSPRPVGVFPGGAPPEGVLGLTGNVWEWCLDAYAEDAYAKQGGQTSPADPLVQGDGGSPRVRRGGAFGYEAWDLRATYRYWYVRRRGAWASS